MQEFNEGDLVEAVKGEESHKGRVDRRRSGELLLNLGLAGCFYRDYLAEHGYSLRVIEKAAPKLPTEPGIYFPRRDFASGIRVVKLDQGWRDSDGEPVTPATLKWLADVQARGDLTRFEPVPVTAKKVLDAIRQRIGSIDSAHDFQAVATQFGVSE